MARSYLSRHRPICSVIQEIKELAAARADYRTINLCDEAMDYAHSMSKRLVEYSFIRDYAQEGKLDLIQRTLIR
jgi:hypothetical protein